MAVISFFPSHISKLFLNPILSLKSSLFQLLYCHQIGTYIIEVHTGKDLGLDTYAVIIIGSGESGGYNGEI